MLFEIILIFLVSTALFRYASGGLGLRTLNIVSLTYYFMMIMGYLGTSLALLGINRNHYLVRRISEQNIWESYFIVALTCIVVPLVIIAVNCLSGNVNVRERLRHQVCAPISGEVDCYSLRTLTMVLLVLCSVCVGYVFATLGTWPILDVLLGGSEDSGLIRMQVSRGFSGNTYVRNIGMLLLTPIVSFLCLISYRKFKTRWWRNAFAASVLLTTIALTYDLEKAPLVYYLGYLFVLDQLCGRRYRVGKIVLVFLILALLVLAAYYVTFGTAGLVLSFENGPLSRIVSSSSAALMLHVQAFPTQAPFLNGQGASGILAMVLGVEGGLPRSSRVVMELYNTQGVQNGTAGVMNAMFPAEAYANWGMPGVIVSLIIVGVFIGVVHNLFLNSKKSIFSLLTIIVLTRFGTLTLFGGFFEYVLSSTFVILVLLLWGIALFCRGKARLNGEDLGNPFSRGTRTRTVDPVLFSHVA